VRKCTGTVTSRIAFERADLQVDRLDGLWRRTSASAAGDRHNLGLLRQFVDERLSDREEHRAGVVTTGSR
jgi:hypothetical protein